MTLPRRNIQTDPLLYRNGNGPIRFYGMRQAKHNGRYLTYRRKYRALYHTLMFEGSFRIFPYCGKGLQRNRCVRKFMGDCVSRLKYNIDMIMWHATPLPHDDILHY